jgi:hypothetical protein
VRSPIDIKLNDGICPVGTRILFQDAYNVANTSDAHVDGFLTTDCVKWLSSNQIQKAANSCNNKLSCESLFFSGENVRCPRNRPVQSTHILMVYICIPTTTGLFINIVIENRLFLHFFIWSRC